MATSTELKDSLQKISALMGLLRSDFLELSEAKGPLQRGPVVEHVQWIADQLDALRDQLVPDKPDATHLHGEHPAHGGNLHSPEAGEPSRPMPPHDTRHRSGMHEPPPVPVDPKRPDDGSQDAHPQQGRPASAMDKGHAGTPRHEGASVPPPPDVPKPSEDDKHH